jgi:hypothetical protein
MVQFRSTGFADIETETAGYLAATLMDTSRALVVLALASPPEACQCEAEFMGVLESIRLLETQE